MSDSQVVLRLFLDEVGIPLVLDTFERRLLIQKKTYLSQLTGFDLRYRFAWYAHGPYSRQLTSDVFRLKEEIDEGDRGFEGRALGPLARQLLAGAPALWANRPGGVTEGDWLELLASLHYVRHIAYHRGNTPRQFAEAFQTVVACKPKFTGREPHARAAWEHLDEVGLIRHKVLPLPAEAAQG